jgi:hypothetical protein
MVGIDAAGNIICDNYPKYVFLSSTTHNGNLGGLTGADQICQDLADAAGLLGTFKAWLSTSTQSPSTRFTHSATPYILTNGTVIANDWWDLIDGTLNAAISLDEKGHLLSSYVWTGTAPNGTPLNPIQWGDGTYYNTNFCADWTGISFLQVGVGNSFAASSEWTFYIPWGCDYPNRLYCFQQ